LNRKNLKTAPKLLTEELDLKEDDYVLRKKIDIIKQ
jgi:hypothetical protein